MDNKPVLAFDCAGAGASIAVVAHGQTYTHALPQGKQAGNLVSAINDLLDTAKIQYGELGAIATTTGPGSFTGLRIGLAALHGFALVHHTPIKLITTLEAMAWSIAGRADAPAEYMVVQKVGKGEVAVQSFRTEDGHPNILDGIRLLPEETQSWPLPAFGNHVPEDSADYLIPDMALLARLAPQLPDAPLADALPLYIRPPDAVIPKTHAWLA